jgi:integrase/recombinase XerD
VLPSLLDEGLSLRTLNCNLHIYKSFAHLLYEEDWITEQFGADFKPFKLQQSSAHTFTDEQLCNLKTGDIFFKELVIRIMKGKDGRARRVPFQQTCGKIIRKYLEDIRGDLETDSLFVNMDNNQISTGALQDKMQAYGCAAEITGVRVSPHTFRHKMKKFYILNGGNPFTLRRILGHPSLKMVDYYVELFSSDIKQQHKKFSSVENMKRNSVNLGEKADFLSSPSLLHSTFNFFSQHIYFVEHHSFQILKNNFHNPIYD